MLDNSLNTLISSRFTNGATPPAPRGQRNILGVVDYGTGSGEVDLRSGAPYVPIHMARGDADAFYEIWETNRPVTAGVEDGISFGHDGEYLFCAARITNSGNYADAVRSVYSNAFALVTRLGYPNIFRMWNFIADINGDNAEGLEVYRDFCLGRAEAFEQFPAGIEMPAATGIGSLGGGIVMYLLAARAGHRVNIENPRQQPAYEYPRQYGPKSPSFARATYLTVAPDATSAGPRQIYVSGTASVVGHETRHAGDLQMQCAETFENLACLLDAANLTRYGIHAGYSLKDLANIKVYVRHEDDIDVVGKLCANVFAPEAHVVLLNVDVCRSDLLVEIEGIVACSDEGY